MDSAVEKDDSINLKLPVISSSQTIGYENKIVQFSSIKNIQSIANKVTQIINDPTVVDNVTDASEWEEIGGIGYSSLGTVNNSGVGVSDAGKPYFIKAMNIFNGVDTDIDFDTITNEELMTLYNQATSKISEQEAFKNLNLSTNKTYITSATESYSYADIVNAGLEMLPIAGTIDEISTWYDNQYADNEALIKNKEQNLTLIQEWITNNIEDITTRKAVKDNLVTSTDPKNDGLNKEAWEKYHGVTKIVLQDPVSILFDSSFLESCYYGLKSYWYNNYKVVLPNPPNISK